MLVEGACVAVDLERERRVMVVVAWIWAVIALDLSLSGWFSVFGLVMAVPALVFARAIRSRGPFIVAAVAVVVAVAWQVAGRLLS